MKKYLRVLPIMFYPYIYMICLVAYIFGLAYLRMEGLPQEYGIYVLFAVAILCNVHVVVLVIENLIGSIRGKYSAKHLAKMNMLIKLVQIPAYILHFILGIIGMILSIWGIGFIIWAIFIDVICIALSGSFGLGASIGCAREKLLSKTEAVLYGFLGYIYCVDVISVIVFYIKLKRDRNC